MPEWWLEATLPAIVFGGLFVVWVVLPARPGEADFASKLRDRLLRKRSRPDE